MALGTAFSARARADAQGRWRLQIPAAPPDSRPFDLILQTPQQSLTCTNVLFGDLWLCAGQSNMALPLSSCDTAAAAIAAATDPCLRMLNESCILPTDGRPWSDTLIGRARAGDVFQGAWRTVTPQSAPALSGLGVMFGQALRQARPHVPLGLIQLAVGGAPVEAFTPASGSPSRSWLDDAAFPAPWCQQRAKANLAGALGKPGCEAIRHPFEPGMIYAGAVAPLSALPIKGVLWYQGESNATTSGSPDTALEPAVMARGLAALITSWRRAWDRDGLPFILVQLPRMNRPWMLFREQQMRVAQATANVGLVITTDTGSPSNVHPRDKFPIAERAAREALRVAYRDPSAPAFAFGVRAQGTRPVIVHFTPGHTLVCKGETLKGFELSADGKAFMAAHAELQPDNTVAIAAAGTAAPSEIRYNWAPAPDGNLYNAAGLPVAPFRLKTTPHP